ncbi:hypothetical protein Tco_0524347 [Tanacetum coccineum]
MTTLQFADTYNLVTFLAKPTKSEGFEQVVDFLNAHTIKYALTVNPTIYTSCIEQFWATVKVKTVNGEQQLQALVDGKKIVVTEASIRRELQLDDEEGTDCLPNATIFEKLTRMGMVKNLDNAGKFLMYPRFIQVFLCNQLERMSSHKRIYVTPSQTKKIFANMRRQGKDFSRRETPLFPTMVVQDQEEMGEGSSMPADPHHTPIITQPSSSQSQRKQKSRRPKKKDTQVPQAGVPSDPTNVADEAINEEPIKKLEKKKGSRTHKLRRLYKVGRSARVVSFEEASLGDQEDASKQGRKIDEIDKDADITLVDETQGRYREEDMFGVNGLDGDEVVVESEVTDKAIEKRNIVEEAVDVVGAVTILVSAATITNVELTLAQTLAELKSARPKTKGVVMQEPKKSTLFVQLLEKRKKHFAAKRVEEKINRPPTRAQQRSIMCTYLKNMAGWKLKDLKNKSFVDLT